MKWVVLFEIALTLLSFGIGIYLESVGRSADERSTSSIFYIIGAIMVGVLLITLLGWWGWTAIFSR